MAAAGWRLPMHGGFATFRPLRRRAVRRAARAAVARRRAPLPAGCPPACRWRCRRSAATACGISTLRALDCLDRCGVRRDPRRAARRDRCPRGRWRSDEAHVYGAGLRYEDLVAAVDVVARRSRATASSRSASPTTRRCSTRRAAASSSTTSWCAEMPRFLRCAYIDQADLLAGRWLTALDAALHAPPRRRSARRPTAPKSSRG